MARWAQECVCLFENASRFVCPHSPKDFWRLASEVSRRVREILVHATVVEFRLEVHHAKCVSLKTRKSSNARPMKCAPKLAIKSVEVFSVRHLSPFQKTVRRGQAFLRIRQSCVLLRPHSLPSPRPPAQSKHRRVGRVTGVVKNDRRVGAQPEIADDECPLRIELIKRAEPLPEITCTACCSHFCDSPEWRSLGGK